MNPWVSSGAVPEVMNLGYRNQPCFFEGNWQAHDFEVFEEHWFVDPQCDCLPFSGVEDIVGCKNCGYRASEEEAKLYYEAHRKPDLDAHEAWELPF